jgi:hypothetical protein
MNIVQAMTDQHLFGKTFSGESWAAWRALLGGFYGLPLTQGANTTFNTLTGGPNRPEQAHRELWLAVGRRGGKSHAAALIAVFEAAFKDHRDKLAPGEVATVMLLAADQKQARTLLRYVHGLLEHPMLKKMVTRETANGIELSNRSAIEIHTASHKAVRGYTCAAVICDEIAFWSNEGSSPDVEIIAALRPSLATLDGKLICISSPYARRGMLWTTYEKHFGKIGQILVAQAPSRMMNPNLPQRVVEDALSDDAARASAEYLAQFRSDIEQFLNIETVAAAQRSNPLEIQPQENTRYFAFADPSGGGKDEFTLAIAHRQGSQTIVDLVTGRKGNPADITAEFCSILKQYKVYRVQGDRYAGAWVPTEFSRHGVTYLTATGNRSELYMTLAPALNAGRIELPPCPKLSAQLVGLERRTARGGRDIIDHAPNAHDDRANAVAGVVAASLHSVVLPRVRSLATEPNRLPGRRFETESDNGTLGRIGIY